MYKLPKLQMRTVGQFLRGELFVFPWNALISGIQKAGEGQKGLDFGKSARG